MGFAFRATVLLD